MFGVLLLFAAAGSRRSRPRARSCSSRSASRSWSRGCVNRGIGSLYLGSIIIALAAPDLLEAAGIVSGAGVGTFCLGVAFLFIAAVRWVSGGGVGWQAALGGILAVIGASSFAFPGFNALFWPLVLVIAGGLLLVRASRRA